VLLIVNVASRCYFSKQYQALEDLQQQFGSHTFAILAFPCNQFLKQEPENIQQITTRYCEIQKISFPIFNKIKVNGPHAAPLYKFLKQQVQQKPWFTPIPWNFTKFLVDQRGQVIKRYIPVCSWQKIADEISVLLKQATS
jgi:glutathione peroxidase